LYRGHKILHLLAVCHIPEGKTDQNNEYQYRTDKGYIDDSTFIFEMHKKEQHKGNLGAGDGQRNGNIEKPHIDIRDSDGNSGEREEYSQNYPELRKAEHMLFFLIIHI
jgi:hypothetical protein